MGLEYLLSLSYSREVKAGEVLLPYGENPSFTGVMGDRTKLPLVTSR